MLHRLGNLTALHLQLAFLSVVWVDGKVHDAGQFEGQLDHVEYRLVLVQPHVVIGYGHRLKGHRFGVLEKRIWTPHILQPVHLQQSVLLRHILRQSQAVILPSLGEEHIRHIGHRVLIDGVQTHHCHMEVDYRGLALLLGRPHLIVALDVLRKDVGYGQALSGFWVKLRYDIRVGSFFYSLKLSFGIVLQADGADHQNNYLDHHF